MPYLVVVLKLCRSGRECLPAVEAERVLSLLTELEEQAKRKSGKQLPSAMAVISPWPLDAYR